MEKWKKVGPIVDHRSAAVEFFFQSSFPFFKYSQYMIDREIILFLEQIWDQMLMYGDPFSVYTFVGSHHAHKNCFSVHRIVWTLKMIDYEYSN